MEKKSILLVDDDIAVRDFLRTALENQYNILEASRYREVIQQLRNHIDLALVDFILPGANGFTILSILKASKPSLPVIIMTGYGSENLAIEAIKHRASDYIKKPIELAYLKDRISEILKN